jgi:fructose-bisphosphate aldolase class II
MPLLSTALLLADAAARRVGIGAFNLVNLESAEALVEAAEATGLPVILQISQNCVHYHDGRLSPLAAAVSALAEASPASIALHLDHAEDAGLAREAVDLGFGSVMYDGAKLSYGDNVATTRGVVAYAHERGVLVEAELGEIGGKDGAHAPGVRTDPGEAAAFVEETGVDALAVAVGSSHAMVTREAELDVDLIARLREAVPVPLVLHGSSGVSDEGIRAAVRSGITKVNVSTHLNGFFTRAIRTGLAGDEGMVDMRKYLGPARDAMAAESARLLRVFARTV